MMREINQREYDAQERYIAEQGRRAAQYQADMRNLARLVREYPDQAQEFLDSRK